MVIETTKSLQSGGFDPTNFEFLYPLEANNFWFLNRNKLIIWAIQKFVGRIQTFLEIGCGTGFVLSGIQKAYPTFKIMGSELFSEGLAFAQKRLPGVELIQMDARSIPYAQAFDAIGAFDVLEHIEEDTQVLQQIYQALTPQGLFFVTVPQHPWLWSQSDDVAMHVRRYTRCELLDKIKAANFSIQYVTSFVSLLLPVMALSRLSHKNKSNHDPVDEFRIPRWLNAALYCILTLERWMIRLGVVFPAGGSLLVVAMKNT